MHLEDIGYFVKVIDCGSINKAARELAMTQPALSASMNRMEQELGIKLLKRSYRGVIPTDAGEKLYQEAAVVLQTIDGWYHLGDSREEDRLSGDVHLLTVPTAYDFLTRKLLAADIDDKARDIQVFFHKCHRDVFMEKLFTDKINIGITSIYSYELEKTVQAIERQNWHAYILHEEEREVLMSCENMYADRTSLKVVDLSALTLACYTYTADTIKSQYKQYFNPNHCYYLDGENSILQIVAENKAVAVYPPKLFSDHFLIKNGSIISKPVEDLVLPATYLLLYPDSELLSSAEKAIIARIKEEFLELNY